MKVDKNVGENVNVELEGTVDLRQDTAATAMLGRLLGMDGNIGTADVRDIVLEAPVLAAMIEHSKKVGSEKRQPRAYLAEDRNFVGPKM